jgi:N-acetylglucosaminyl-diphospho-decaprenol L-rhamnosyltransferase
VPDIEVTYCVVNTSHRELLLRGLDAIARERVAVPFATEALVLDNGSRDGSAEAARAHPAVDEVIALPERRGKALNDSELMRCAGGRYALLLNEDSELLPGATLALWQALQAHPRAACAGAQLLRPGVGTPATASATPAAVPGTPAATSVNPAAGGDALAATSDPGVAAGHSRGQPCAWRFPTVTTALAGAVFAHRLYTVQSKGQRTREVDWCQSSALLVRLQAAAQVGYMDPDFFVYSDEVDFARRLRNAGWRSLYVPGARAIHHEQLATSAVPERRIVEMARGRDLYMRKHHSPAAARAVRWLTAWIYAWRALAALLLPGHSPRRYWCHVTATLCPRRRAGLREAAVAYNRGA